jgi:NAD+ synthase (glutamine-hydrolysing)
MRQTLTISTASINTTPLDVTGNLALIEQAVAQAVKAKTDVLLLPELVLTGYGCEDMFFCADWLETLPEFLAEFSRQLPRQMMVAIGFPLLIPGGQVFNAVALMSRDHIHGIVCKQNLARNGIHYEPRWFTAWPAGEVMTIQFAGQPVQVGDLVFEIDGVRLGFEICEDSWVAARPGRSLYERQVDVILNPSASHFAIGKQKTRRQFVCEGSRAYGAVYVYTNLLGCEAGRAVYDGDAMIASNGELVMSSNRLSFAPWQVRTATVNIGLNRAQRMISSQRLHPAEQHGVSMIDFRWVDEDYQRALNAPASFADEDPHEVACRAIALGLWDWQRKTYTGGFAVSLSGGADSALCSALVWFAQVQAAITLGEEQYRRILAAGRISVEPQGHKPLLEWIHTDVMPQVLTTVYQGSEHSGDVTRHAASGLAAEMGAQHHDWSIADLVTGYLKLINDLTPDDPMTWEKDDLALQNIQARVRSPGIWLVANRQNKLLIATSNLSEASVGYCTMDGDTSGVLSPIGGVSKSRVLQINRYILEEGIPVQDCAAFSRVKLAAMQAIVDQAPTAELRPVEQTDEADLMPYPVMDIIRRISQTQNVTPKGVLQVLLRDDYGRQFPVEQLVAWLKRYYGLYCRNQWKRERIAASFHIEADSADPKTYRRFPILSNQLRDELADMEMFARNLI